MNGKAVCTVVAIAALACCPALAEVTEVAPGVYFRPGDAERGEPNGGYIICEEYIVAVGAPSPEASARMFEEAQGLSDKPLRFLIMTQAQAANGSGVDVFIEKGVTVILEEKLRRRYEEGDKAGSFIGVLGKLVLAGGGKTVEIFTNGTAHSPHDVFVYLPKPPGVLFTGDAVVNSPEARLGNCNLENWIDTLELLGDLNALRVCPGRGGAYGANTQSTTGKHGGIAEFRDYLVKLRDEVAYQVAQGRSLETTLENVNVPGRGKYCRDEVFADHVKAVYAQLTAELPKPPAGLTPRALILIGDHYHPPAYIRPPLDAAFKKIGMPVDFLYDVTKLTAENLRGFSLLVVLRDGMVWPDNDRQAQWWLSDEQAAALGQFIKDGGGYLSLHNSTALNALGPKPNLYRDVLGASYNGHGAVDEKFTVRVVNKDHPVTRGVTDYVAVDERHDPKIHADNVVVLLEAISGEKKSVNAYARTYGRGRIVHLANGHNRKVLENPSMQKLIANAALWCSGIQR